HKDRAAEALRVTAADVKSLGCVDEIIPEPAAGIHADRDAGIEILASALARHLAELKAISADELVAARQSKFRNIARFYTEG
ncbi:MAG: acetyl-CoA carboxylase carboxyltransferase subunit alpha, partial [Terracidiphilus sp.]